MNYSLIKVWLAIGKKGYDTIPSFQKNLLDGRKALDISKALCGFYAFFALCETDNSHIKSYGKQLILSSIH